MSEEPKIAIQLGEKHRDLLLEERLFINSRLRQIIRETPLRQPIELSRGNWDHIQGCIALEANHTEDQQWGRTLDRVFRKIDKGCHFAGRWGS
jgi:hypothetical protein